MKTVQFLKENWLVLVLATMVVMTTVAPAHSCELRTNMQTGVTTQVGCPADFGVPPPMPSRVIGNQQYYGQGYGQGNSGMVNLGNVSPGPTLIGALIGFITGLFNDNKASDVAILTGVGAVAGKAYEKITEPAPQQQQVAQAPQETPATNWCVRSGKKYNCGQNVVVIHNGKPQCLPAELAKTSGEEICTGIK